MADNSYKNGDKDNDLLKKILRTLTNAFGSGSGGSADALDVVVKDATSSTKAAVTSDPLTPADPGLVVKDVLISDWLENGSWAPPISAQDGAIVTLGGQGDTLETDPTQSASLIALAKGVLSLISDGLNVGGFTTLIKDTTAVSASPDYSIGDAFGGKRTLSNVVRVSGGTAVWESLVIMDRANQKPGLEIYIFDADPSGATITDNSAFDFSTDDLKVIAKLTVASSDYVTIDSTAWAKFSGIGQVVKPASGTTLYAAFVCTGAPNMAATTDIQAVWGFLQD